MSENVNPAIYAQGSFTAKPPFDAVVKQNIFFTVEAVRTIAEMQALKLDLFKMVFEPVGVDPNDYQARLAEAVQLGACIVTLTSRNNKPVYVPTNYLTSFPLVDGVTYERFCIISDLGAVPPSLKDRVNSAIDHFNNYIRNSLGIQNPTTVIGTIPTRGYVSLEQSLAWEKTRAAAVTEDPSDLLRLEKALAENAELKAYITVLENQVKAKS